MGRATGHFDTIGLIYNAQSQNAAKLAITIMEWLDIGKRLWMCAAQELDPSVSDEKNADLIITVGGDGTILSASRLAAPKNIPILGINMGRLGFMTELRGTNAIEYLPTYFEEKTWLDKRAMIKADLVIGSNNKISFNALNDVVIGHGEISRLINVEASIDGDLIATYRADAVLVSTATGSTGYNLSAGGSILHPESRSILLTPVAPHMALKTPLVVPDTANIKLTVKIAEKAVLSVDNFERIRVNTGASVEIKSSGMVTSFLRSHKTPGFYSTLLKRLNPDNSN